MTVFQLYWKGCHFSQKNNPHKAKKHEKEYIYLRYF